MASAHLRWNNGPQSRETADQFMWLCVFSFFASAAAACLVLKLLFVLVCLGLGHNTMEMIYGGFAVYFFTFVAAVEGAWLLPDDIRNSSSVRRLTHWLRFR